MNRVELDQWARREAERTIDKVAPEWLQRQPIDLPDTPTFKGQLVDAIAASIKDAWREGVEAAALRVIGARDNITGLPITDLIRSMYAPE